MLHDNPHKAFGCCKCSANLHWLLDITRGTLAQPNHDITNNLLKDSPLYTCLCRGHTSLHPGLGLLRCNASLLPRPVLLPRCLRSRPRPVARAVFSCTASKCSQQLHKNHQASALCNLPSSAKHGERLRSADLDVLCSQQWQPKCASWWATSAASGRAIRGLLDATQEHMSGAVSNWYLGIARAQAHHRSNVRLQEECMCAPLCLRPSPAPQPPLSWRPWPP